MKIVRLLSILPLFCSITYAAIFCDSEVSINFKSKPDYKISYLSHPERLVIDIKHIDDLKIISSKSSKCINRTRTGVMAKNTMRLVLELNHAMNYTETTKKIISGHQLNIKIADKKSSKTPKSIVYRDYVKARAASKNKTIIVIDPGHGGHDPGAVSRHNIQEKNITLSLAKKLAYKVNSLNNVKAYLTRTRDEYLTLRQRLKVARDNHADLFISIHADSNPNRNAKGVSVYALSERGATSEAARVLADKENIERVISTQYRDDLALNAVLIDLLQVSTVHSSLYFGKTVLSKLCRIASCHRNNVEQAGFVVLKSPNIPSILIETGFVSNDTEAKKLVTNSYQDKLTDGILSAIKLYIHYDDNKIQVRNIKVNKGDTLYSIAKKYHTSVAKIVSDNKIKNNSLVIGSYLKIT